jgi:hypothetical protein
MICQEFYKNILEFNKKFMEAQEELGEPFSKVLYENLDRLLDEENQETITEETGKNNAFLPL